MPISNSKQIAAALRKKQQVTLDRMADGIGKALLYVQAQSQRIVPVDYGNLKASAFTRVAGKGTAHVRGTVGYTAAYAVFVHENLDAAHGSTFNAKYAAELAHAAGLRRRRQGGTTGPFRHNRGPNQTAKFLERPFREAINDGSLVAIVSAEVKP